MTINKELVKTLNKKSKIKAVSYLTKAFPQDPYHLVYLTRQENKYYLNMDFILYEKDIDNPDGVSPVVLLDVTENLEKFMLYVTEKKVVDYAYNENFISDFFKYLNFPQWLSSVIYSLSVFVAFQVSKDTDFKLIDYDYTLAGLDVVFWKQENGKQYVACETVQNMNMIIFKNEFYETLEFKER